MIKVRSYGNQSLVRRRKRGIYQRVQIMVNMKLWRLKVMETCIPKIMVNVEKKEEVDW